MMDIQKNLLLAGIIAIAFMLLVRWNSFETTENNTQTLSSETTLSTVVSETGSASALSDVPVVKNDSDTKQGVNDSFSNRSALIRVKTDSLDISIDPVGGDIVRASLPRFLKDIDVADVAFEIMNRNEDILYIAQSGLIGKNGTDNQQGRPVFRSEKNEYLMTGNEVLEVDLVTEQESGAVITKRFTFHPESYLVQVDYLIDNQSGETWSGNLFAQIKRDDHPVETKSGFGVSPFLGVATTTADTNYKKLSFDDIAETPFTQTFEGGWVAFIQHYFISAWIPEEGTTNQYSIRKLDNKNIYILGLVGEELAVQPGQQQRTGIQLYVGPKDVETLESISPYLDLTVDYGWLWWIAKPLHTILSSAYKVLGNWGWSIICLTIIIKMIFFPLSNKAYLSMAAMRKVTPKMMEIREKYGDNRQKLQEEMMKLYRTEKINPLGGCLPMLIQMPVFIALYWTLLESVEIRHAPFIGWINDLSVMDPYFCLPLLMGVSMFLQQKMNPTPPDPTQAKVMQMMPIIFTFMFLWFPAGLVLYWLVNNIISMIHQAYINYKIEGSVVKK